MLLSEHLFYIECIYCWQHFFNHIICSHIMKFKDYGKDCGEGVDDFALKEEDPLKDTETSGSS